MPGGRAGTPGASYERTRREQESQEDREARLGRHRLLPNHLKPRQRCIPQLYNIFTSLQAVIFIYKVLIIKNQNYTIYVPNITPVSEFVSNHSLCQEAQHLSVSLATIFAEEKPKANISEKFLATLSFFPLIDYNFKY